MSDLNDLPHVRELIEATRGKAPNADLRRKAMAVGAFRLWLLLNLDKKLVKEGLDAAPLIQKGILPLKADPLNYTLFGLISVICPELINEESLTLINSFEDVLSRDLVDVIKTHREGN